MYRTASLGDFLFLNQVLIKIDVTFRISAELELDRSNEYLVCELAPQCILANLTRAEISFEVEVLVYAVQLRWYQSWHP